MWLRIDRWLQQLRPRSVLRQASDVLRRKRLKELDVKVALLKLMRDYGIETVLTSFEKIVDEQLNSSREEK